MTGSATSTQCDECGREDDHLSHWVWDGGQTDGDICVGCVARISGVPLEWFYRFDWDGYQMTATRD